MTPRDLWPRFRALPLAVQAGASLVALVAALWLAGGIGRAWSAVQDWRTDRAVAADLERVRALEVENAELRGAVAVKDAELADVKSRLEAQIEINAQLAEEAKRDDEQVTRARSADRQTRRGRPARPVTDRDFDDRLRRATESDE